MTGTILGELAALRLNKNRTLTIKAKSRAVVYCLWADDFKQSLADQPQVHHCHDKGSMHSPALITVVLKQEYQAMSVLSAISAADDGGLVIHGLHS